MGLFTEYSYLKSNRLSDIIRLIAVLAIEERWSFRKSDGLNGTLNGKPKSAADWFDIAKEHPEFFKFNTAGDSIVLLIRFLNRTNLNEQEKYEPLTIDQTQKLIEQAIILHDKQIGRLQKNSFLVPILTAVITAVATGLISYLTLTSNNKNINQIEKKIDNLAKQIKFQSTNTKTISKGNR